MDWLVTNITAVQAAGIKLLPFIDTVELDGPLDDSGHGVAQNPARVEQRVPAAPQYSELPNSPDWLKLISQQPLSNHDNDYYYGTTQGTGSKVYIIDTGYFTTAGNNAPIITVSFR